MNGIMAILKNIKKDFGHGGDSDFYMRFMLLIG
jgi:hypothetical protein